MNSKTVGVAIKLGSTPTSLIISTKTYSICKCSITRRRLWPKIWCKKCSKVCTAGSKERRATRIYCWEYCFCGVCSVLWWVCWWRWAWRSSFLRRSIFWLSLTSRCWGATNEWRAILKAYPKIVTNDIRTIQPLVKMPVWMALLLCSKLNIWVSLQLLIIDIDGHAQFFGAELYSASRTTHHHPADRLLSQSVLHCYLSTWASSFPSNIDNHPY